MALFGTTLPQDQQAQKSAVLPGGVTQEKWETGWDGQPVRPGFGNMIDPGTGQLIQNFKSSSQYNPAGINQLRSQALGDAPSRWSMLEEANQRDAAAKASAGKMGGLRSGLAVNGGLRGGQNERLAMAGMSGNLANQNSISRGMAEAEDKRKQAMISQLLPQEMGLAQYDRDQSKYNINNALDEIRARRAADIAAYLEKLKQWGTVRAAQIQGPKDD